MTSPYVVPARRSAPWRIVLVALTCVASAPVAAFTAFWATVEWTGCFIECTDGGGNHASGGLLWLATAALLASGPALAWLLLRSGRAVGASVGGVVATLLTGALLMGLA
jgi:hypothetical protein